MLELSVVGFRQMFGVSIFRDEMEEIFIDFAEENQRNPSSYI